MNKYPKYKNSGIDWLGDIPEHWDVRKLKNDSTIKNGSTPSTNNESFWDGNIIWITPAEINDVIFINNSKRKITQAGYESCGTNLVPKNSIILTTRAPIGKLVIAEKTLCTNQGCKSIIPNNFNTKFQLYQFKIRNKELNALGTGTTFMELGNFELKNLQYIAPPISEQTTIANFLDYKLEKIDRFITKKKQLIELLNEQKLAIINHSVTKGLNPNAKMKDSGIEWLGDIPEHWEVRKLKFVAKIKTGRTPKIESSQYDYFKDGEINWFTPGDFGKEGFLYNSKRKINNFALTENQVELFPKNSIYLIGIGGTIGKIGISKEKGSSNQQINAIIFKENIFPKFGFYSLKTAKHQIDLLADFTTLPILNQSKTKQIVISFPNYQEQTVIVNHVESETTKIEKTITTIEKEIALVEEYKTALIAEAVTGKIDVRDFENPQAEMPMAMAAEEVANYGKEN